MKFTENEEFKNDMLYYVELSGRIKDLAKKSTTAPDGITKSLIFKQMILAVHDYDLHIYAMIEKYPEYYDQYKLDIDAIKKDNEEYIVALSDELKKLPNYVLN